jgi:DNA-binding XRE family transcriptional regulator
VRSLERESLLVERALITQSRVTFRVSWLCGVACSLQCCENLMASKFRKTSVHKLSKQNCGKKIFHLRTTLKLTQLQLARRIGTSPMSISRWEADTHQPLAKHLIRFGLLATPDDCWFFWEQAGLTLADVLRVLPSP